MYEIRTTFKQNILCKTWVVSIWFNASFAADAGMTQKKMFCIFQIQAASLGFLTQAKNGFSS